MAIETLVGGGDTLTQRARVTSLFDVDTGSFIEPVLGRNGRCGVEEQRRVLCSLMELPGKVFRLL